MGSPKLCNSTSKDHSTNGNSRKIVTDRLIFRRHKSSFVLLYFNYKQTSKTWYQSKDSKFRYRGSFDVYWKQFHEMALKHIKTTLGHLWIIWVYKRINTDLHWYRITNHSRVKYTLLNNSRNSLIKLSLNIE